MAAAEPGAFAEDRAAIKAEAASAGLVIQGLVKAARGFAIYLPNNPLHEKFFEDFRRRIGEHLEEFGPLRLDLTHDSIVCRGETIYASDDARESIAFRLYADGLRALWLAEGIDAQELRTLIGILGQTRGDQDEDDSVTRLWSADLPHLTYFLAELPLAGGEAIYAAGGARAAHEGAIRRYAAELSAAPPLPPAPVSRQVFGLDEEELAALQALLAAEERSSPLEDMAGIIEAVLGAEEEQAVLEEFLEIIARLCGDLMLTGRIDQAVRLIGVLLRLGERTDLRPGHAAAIGAARTRVLTPEVVDGLSRLLAGSQELPRESLRALVAALGRPAVEPFCRILGDVPGKETRRVLVEALAETGRGAPELFLPFLADDRWYLVRNTIYILRRIADPEVARAVLRCGKHRDARVRKEALLYFDETGDPAGEQLMLTLLADESAALRIAAARALARRGTPVAVERLLALAEAPDFERRALPEREAIWEALGELSPERAFPLLRELLLKRRWFGGSRELAQTACAVAGLRRIGTPEAVEVLRKAGAAKRGEARELVEKALRALEGRRPPARDRGGEADGA